MSLPEIGEIIRGVQERHHTWSDNLSFATTHTNDSALVDIITLNRSIPDNELEPERIETIVNGLTNEVINSEVQDFLLQLNNHDATVRKTTTQDEMVEDFYSAYTELFQLRQPDFVIWSAGMQGAFTRNATDVEQNRFNELNLRGVTIPNQFNDIILGSRNLCGKTYQENRLNVLQNRNIDAHSTHLAFGINQRLDFSSEFTYARITVN